MTHLNLTALPDDFGICRLSPDADIPAWAISLRPLFLARTFDELSIICDQRHIPDDARCSRGWRLVKFEGPFDFDAVGILDSVAGPLARAGISIVAVSTFDTDYVLLHGDRFDEAKRVLTAAGHVITDLDEAVG